MQFVPSHKLVRPLVPGLHAAGCGEQKHTQRLTSWACRQTTPIRTKYMEGPSWDGVVVRSAGL